MITAHRDGFWLNDAIDIVPDSPDPKNGNASHVYDIYRTDVPFDRGLVGTLEFQHGPRDDPNAVQGLTDAAVLAVVLDRMRGFQSGPFACTTNAEVIGHLEAALKLLQERAQERANRGVLGTLSR